jgi:hypothetical protein
MTRSDEFYEAAVNYNRKKYLPLPQGYGPNPDPDTKAYADIVATFQEGTGLKVDGKCGPSTLTAMRDELLEGGETQVLAYEDLVHLAEYTQPFEGQYWSCNRDGEYEGLFDRPPDRYHNASKNKPGGTPRHIGLSFGYIQFTQDGGALGVLLKKMFEADKVLFGQIFGAYSAELLEVTNRKGKKRVNGRSPRVQPINRHDLWHDQWVLKFKQAGREPVFQRCQVELAVDNYMMPALKNCEKLGLKSARAIVIVFDRGVQYGPGGAYSKLLKPTMESMRGRDDGHSEHAFLRTFMHKYEDKRWGHRVEKVWRNPSIGDGPCDWSALTT